MTFDRSTKFLLAIIALGVWGLLLKPTVLPAQAQAPGSLTPAVAVGMNSVYVAYDGKVYRWKPELGKTIGTGIYASGH